jgi:hypothetical protein
MDSFYHLYGDLTLENLDQHHLDESKAARLTELLPHFRWLEVKRIRGTVVVVAIYFDKYASRLTSVFDR